ncbi:MAG TPA: DUF5693 family protein [Fervidobacterium sp.]|nr:DUF5693 family protein [Fervidobacterium sp.]
MRLPLFPRNETYINIILTIFSFFLIISFLIRIPMDRSHLSVSVFFNDDEQLLFYTGNEEISDKVKIIIPMDDLAETESVQDFLKKVDGRFVGNLEFYGNQEFVKKFYKETHYDKIVKVHYVKPEELPKYDDYTLFKRLWRAVLERSVDVIVLPRADVVSTAYERFRDFFQISQEIPAPDSANWNNRIYMILLGIFVSLQMPIAVLSFLFYSNYWLYISVVSIIGTIALFFSSRNKFTQIANYLVLGLLTNFSLYSFGYLNDLELYRGVKISLVALPIIVALNIIYEIIKEKKVSKVYIILSSIAGALAIVYLILRSGNYGYVTNFEEKVRLLLENIFIIRPRIKELLFLPMFLLSDTVENKYWKNILLFFGSIGLVSIFNSFCHIKAPIFTVVYREVVTILVSAVIYAVGLIIKDLVLIWTGKK